MSVREKDNPELYTRIQSRISCGSTTYCRTALRSGWKKELKPSTIHTMGRELCCGRQYCSVWGRYREDPILVGKHIPPHFNNVPNLMDRSFHLSMKNWTIVDHPTLLAGYALWRLIGFIRLLKQWKNSQGGLLLLDLLETGRLLPGRK